MSSEDFSENITWTQRLEVYFSDTGEKAQSLSWAHKKSEALYSLRRTYIDLPVIALSSITGFCSVGSGLIFGGQESLSSITLGVISLFVGFLNTTSSQFGWAKRAEAHRISAIHYSRLCRFVSIQLSLPRQERMTPHDLLKQCREQQERLAEISPLIPQPVIDAFIAKFGKLKDITLPEELNGIEPITVQNEYDFDREDQVRKNINRIPSPFASPIARKNVFQNSRRFSQSGQLAEMKGLYLKSKQNFFDADVDNKEAHDQSTQPKDRSSSQPNERLTSQPSDLPNQVSVDDGQLHIEIPNDS